MAKFKCFWNCNVLLGLFLSALVMALVFNSRHAASGGKQVPAGSLMNRLFRNKNAESAVDGFEDNTRKNLLENMQATFAAFESNDTRFDAIDQEAGRRMSDAHSEPPDCGIQNLLTRRTLLNVKINPEMRVKVDVAAAEPFLRPGVWNSFVLLINNDSGSSAPLHMHLTTLGGGSRLNRPLIDAELLSPGKASEYLSGAPVEYRIMRLRTFELGHIEARISLDLGQGTQDLGFRNNVDVLFNCASKSSGQKIVKNAYQ